MLTICLISQGRSQLSEFLDSMGEIAKLNYVNFVLVDNGAPQAYSKMLMEWSDSHKNSIYVRRDINCTDLNELWPDFNSHLSEWVVFPGDDDRFILSGIIEWKRLADSNPSLNAIAMSAKILHADGSTTGEVVPPSIAQISDTTSELAYSLHSPPFFWPALFIRASAVEKPFPISRYVVDWVTGINLVMLGNFMTSSTASIEYRRHETQESNLVSFNRKLFEGVYHLDSFINSKAFQKWVESRSEDELFLFWHTLNLFPPLYGDPELSNTLLIEIARIIRTSQFEIKIQNHLIANLSLRIGSLLHDESIKETLGMNNTQSMSFGNLRIENEQLQCPILSDLSSSFKGVDNSFKVRIFCKHNPNRLGIPINCDQYLNLPRRHALDALVRDISLTLETQGSLAFRISPTERGLILFARELKKFIPPILKKPFRRI